VSLIPAYEKPSPCMAKRKRDSITGVLRMSMSLSHSRCLRSLPTAYTYRVFVDDHMNKRQYGGSKQGLAKRVHMEYISPSSPSLRIHFRHTRSQCIYVPPMGLFQA
jgi:hypothetical protein